MHSKMNHIPIVVIAVLAAVVSRGRSTAPEPWCESEEAIQQVYNVGKHHCNCDPKNEGSLKYGNGQLQVCNGRKWLPLQYEVPIGNEERPGLSCQDILEKGKRSQNGIYYIRMKDQVEPFPVYCDMRDGGYTMVFKAVGGNGKDIFPTYSSNKPSAESVRAALDVTNHYKQEHYKNRILLKSNWAKFDPAMVKIVLYKSGREVLSLRFDAKFSGKSSDYLNWFSLSKLTSSPWTDVKYEPKNYFAVKGGCHPLCRDFFINRNYGGCNADAGWLVTTGKACNWEKAHPWPSILYTKKTTYVNWNKAEDVGVADVLAVFVKEKHDHAAGPRGGRENPGQSCKDILSQRHSHAQNGVYWLKLDWEADAFQAYCDMQSGGYTMVFKAVSGIGQDILAAYRSKIPSNEHERQEMDVRKGNGHYKNRILLDANWRKFNPTSVRVVLYNRGKEELAMKFNGKSTNYQNWFTAARLLSSPYEDIQRSRRNFFSVAGHSQIKRYFFINRNYGGCPADAGWLVTTGTACTWEKRLAFPTIIYSKLKTATNWNSYESVGTAEVMAIYVQ